MPRVGYVWIGSARDANASIAGLRQGLADRGYIIGRNDNPVVGLPLR